MLLLGAGASASVLSSVVPPNGTVAGHGYAYWLQREWQINFNSPASGPTRCQTVRVDGQRVAVIEDLAGGKHTCSEPAGRPIFAVELAAECSTLPMDHMFGTTAPQLERCARALLKGAVVSASLDGHRVPHFNRYDAATGIFSLHIPRARFHGVKQRHARAAAFGYGLLLRGLEKGNHRIDSKGTFGGNKFESSLTLHVH
jgi:hypothetical protein